MEASDLHTINLHDVPEEPVIDVTDRNDPYADGSVKIHSTRRKWLIIGVLVIGIVFLGGVIGAASGKSKNQSAHNSPAVDNPGAPTPSGGTASGAVPTASQPATPYSPTNLTPRPPGPAPGSGQTAMPTTPVYAYIKSIAPDGGFAMDFFPNSYQAQAFEWLERSCEHHNKVCHVQYRIRQRYALACIYFATYSVASAYTDYEIGVGEPVPGWINDSGWLTDEDECTWAGITCHNNGMVERIDLHDNMLTGKFPPEAVLLKEYLKHFDIENNLAYNVDSEVEWLGEMTNLESLNIAQTPFEYDGIPTVFGNLKKLVHLDCSYSLFFGQLRPEVFEGLHEVQYLYIGGNSYNSSIPDTIGDMQNLLYLYAEYSDVEGDLSFIKNMPKIFELWVDRNPKMKGPIPPEIGDLITLESLSLTNCGLTGPIPEEMGNLYRMQQMWLFANELEGGIPASIGNLTRMNRFEVEQNLLAGDMPEEICDLTTDGRLEIVEADCDSVITNCPCCTCCGPQCAIEAPKSTQNGNKTPGNERQRRLQFVTEQRRRRRLQKEESDNKEQHG